MDPLEQTGPNFWVANFAKNAFCSFMRRHYEIIASKFKNLLKVSIANEI